ncbi:unnamed protein product [Closterium sp. NIES-54]
MSFANCSGENWGVGGVVVWGASGFGSPPIPVCADAARAGVGTFTRLSTTGAASPPSPPLPSVPASPPVGSRSPVLGHAPQFAATRLCFLVMPVAVGGGSSVSCSPRPFGVALAALALPIRSAPVAPVAAMSVAGSPAHACSTVVDSGRESAGVAVQPRVVAPTPEPAFVLAPAADVAPLPSPGAVPSPALNLPVLPSPAETAAVAGVAPASGVAPPPAPEALPVVSPAASLDAPGGKSAPPLPAASASAHALPPAVQQRNSCPHSPSPQDERDGSRRRRDSPRRRRPPADWHVRQGGWRGGRGRRRGGWLDAPVTMADLQRVVSDAMRLERNGQASQSNSPHVAPAHASRPPSAPYEPALPLPQSAIPPPLGPSASAAAHGNRMRLPWVPPVAGMEFVTATGGPVTAQYPSLLPVAPAPPAVSVPVQSLVGPLPSAVVPEASLGQLWRLSEGLRAVHLIQVYGHAALSQGAHMDPGPRDECLDAADRLAELLAPVLAAPARGGVAGPLFQHLWPRVSLPETSPTLRWTGEVGDASTFRVWDALSLVRDTTASKLSPRTLRCVFLGFPTDAPPWQFYHPASRRVLSS